MNEEFVKMEYQTLREEIKETKSRIFKIINFALTIVPIATLVGNVYKIGLLIIAIPFIVMVVATLYLAENHALMRCGRYIKEHIEPKIGEHEGWERWLANKKNNNRRSVDQLLSHSFFILFFLYYIFSSCMAVNYLRDKELGLEIYLSILIYISIGFIYFIYFIRNVEFCTDTKKKAQRQ